MRSAWVVGLGVLVAVTACSGNGGTDEKQTPAHRAERIHHWTAAPCSLFRGKEILKGFKVGYTLDVADSGAQTDVDGDGKQWSYQGTTCTMQVKDAQQRIWKLDASANIYEKAGPACSVHRVHEDLDRASASPETVDAWTYRLSVEKDGRPGRTLEMCDGNALFTVSVYGPSGSPRTDVEGTADRLSERAAALLETGLRGRDA
jgi:hypothetical protein